MSKLYMKEIGEPSSTIWVGNVDEDVTEREIRKAFESYGQIKGIKQIPRLRCTIVDFVDIESAAKALGSNCVLFGKTLKLTFGPVIVIFRL
jgi:RNA recognition motif-containing protein